VLDGLGEDPGLRGDDLDALLEPRSTMIWLRAMANNPHCQAAIAVGLRGPSLHVVGGAPELSDCLALVAEWVDPGGVDGVIVTAFDLCEGGPAAAGVALPGERSAVELLRDAVADSPPAITATQLLAGLARRDGWPGSGSGSTP
jgi:hypothetical protein